MNIQAEIMARMGRVTGLVKPFVGLAGLILTAALLVRWGGLRVPWVHLDRPTMLLAALAVWAGR